MSDLSELITAIIDININDDIKISKKRFYKNKTVENIIKKYKFNNKSKNKLYQFAIFVVRFENNRIRKKVGKITDEKCDNIFFNNIKNVRITNIRYFSALFLQFILFNRITLDELKKYYEVLGKMSKRYFDFIWYHDTGRKRLFNKEYGTILFKNNLAIKVFAIGDLEFELNDDGVRFFNNIFIDFSKKEKKMYSKIINLNKLSQFMTAKEHRQNYLQTLEKIKENEKSIELARIHEGDFKVFFEEYDVLIKYSLSKYGDNCQIRFCGKENSKKLKYDGLIKNNNLEERVEITYPFFSEDETNYLKHLNHYGMSGVKVVDANTYIDDIVKVLVKSIKEKNNKKSYDSSISLVVMVEANELVIDIDEHDIEKLKKGLEHIKKEELIFGNVYVLISRYVKGEFRPWLVKVK